MTYPKKAPAAQYLQYAAWLLCLSAVGLAAASCTTPTPATAKRPISEVPSPAPATARRPITELPSPTPAVVERPVSEPPRPALKEIVVLHTNDNWGETEPCG